MRASNVQLATNSYLIRKLFGLILLAIASKAEAQCPIDRSLSLCCRSLENFSSNSYVWENICGFHDPVDPTTLVAGGCFTTSTCLNGLYDACCERYLPCSASTDGTIGFNCSGHLVH
ncbi:hypothetical protein ABKN59_004301 [Abortiporus biennis]